MAMGEGGAVPKNRILGQHRQHRRRRLPIQHGREQLSEGSSEKFFEEVDDVKNESLENQTNIRCEFGDGSWKNPNFIFDPMPRPYSRLGRGATFFTTLFQLPLSSLSYFGPQLS